MNKKYYTCKLLSCVKMKYINGHMVDIDPYLVPTLGTCHTIYLDGRKSLGHMIEDSTEFMHKMYGSIASDHGFIIKYGERVIYAYGTVYQRVVL